jgi:hypothetical protein
MACKVKMRKSLENNNTCFSCFSCFRSTKSRKNKENRGVYALRDCRCSAGGKDDAAGGGTLGGIGARNRDGCC